MSRENFIHDVIMFANMQNVARVASFLNMKIDELIDDAYNNEFDDFEFHSHNDFIDFVDHVITNYIQ